MNKHYTRKPGSSTRLFNGPQGKEEALLTVRLCTAIVKAITMEVRGSWNRARQ
jgi:hypothetical protein